MKELDFTKDVLPLKNKLFRQALGITLDNAVAEDLVQETMLRIWSKRQELSGVESVEAYCTAMVRNLALDHMRKAEHGNVRLDDMTTGNDNSEDTSANPFDLVANKERLRIVGHLIDSLPDKQKAVVRLRDIEEKSYKEISAELGISEDQVKVNLFRARQKIRQGLTNIENYGL